MKAKLNKEFEKFVDEFIMTKDDPLKEAVKIIHEIYQNKIAKLEKQIADLQKENAKT